MKTQDMADAIREHNAAEANANDVEAICAGALELELVGDGTDKALIDRESEVCCQILDLLKADAISRLTITEKAVKDAAAALAEKGD